MFSIFTFSWIWPELDDTQKGECKTKSLFLFCANKKLLLNVLTSNKLRLLLQSQIKLLQTLVKCWGVLELVMNIHWCIYSLLGNSAIGWTKVPRLLSDTFIWKWKILILLLYQGAMPKLECILNRLPCNILLINNVFRTRSHFITTKMSKEKS